VRGGRRQRTRPAHAPCPAAPGPRGRVQRSRRWRAAQSARSAHVHGQPGERAAMHAALHSGRCPSARAAHLARSRGSGGFFNTAQPSPYLSGSGGFFNTAQPSTYLTGSGGFFNTAQPSSFSILFSTIVLKKTLAPTSAARGARPTRCRAHRPTRWTAGARACRRGRWGLWRGVECTKSGVNLGASRSIVGGGTARSVASVYWEASKPQAVHHLCARSPAGGGKPGELAVCGGAPPALPSPPPPKSEGQAGLWCAWWPEVEAGESDGAMRPDEVPGRCG
jgi:hypothetical protein